MKYEIKKLNDTNAVVISDEEIKINDPITDGYRVWYWRDNCSLLGRKKVIATISPFKIEGLPMLELPSQEEDVEKLAELKYPISKGGSMWMPSSDDCNKANKQEGFKEGYKAAQKQYNEDLDKVIKELTTITTWDSFKEHPIGQASKRAMNILQSLQKKQFPISVELTEDLRVIKWIFK